MAFLDNISQEINCRERPLSGYHFKVNVTQSDGTVVWFGGFQSLTLSVRNSTETFLNLGEKIPMFLDGEYQIAWVLEKGLVSGDFLQKIFGTSDISRCSADCLSDTLRFNISFYTQICKPKFTNSNIDTEYQTSLQSSGLNKNFKVNILTCKLDNMSLGLMPGRRVAAERWEGVAEGIKYIDTNTTVN